MRVRNSKGKSVGGAGSCECPANAGAEQQEHGGPGDPEAVNAPRMRVRNSAAAETAAVRKLWIHCERGRCLLGSGKGALAMLMPYVRAMMSESRRDEEWKN